MKLRRIEIAGWQCFADRVEVGGFGDGVNVVHATNGTGKSTLFAALRHAMFDGHRGRRQDQLARRPWGRSLTPRVTVDFERDRAVWQVAKTFLDGPTSMLRREVGGRFVAHAEHDAADDALRTMFNADVPGKTGPRSADTWGVMGALWVQQDALELGPLTATLSARVRDSLGAQLTPAAGGDAIERAIAARYGEIYTASGKFYAGAKASRVTTLRDAIVPLLARRDERTAAVARFDAASERVETLGKQRELARHAERECEQRIATLRESARRFAALDADQQTQAARMKQARSTYDAINERIAQIADAKARLANAQRALAELATRSEALAAERRAADRQRDDAAATVSQLRLERATVDEAMREATIAATFARATATTNALGERVAKLRELDRDLAEYRRRLAATPAPTAKQMTLIRVADQARREAKIGLEASMISLELTPEGDATADVRVAERPGAIALPSGRSTTVRGAPEVIVDVPGFGRIRASGPATSAEAMREHVADAEAAWTALVAPFGGGELDAIERAASDAADIGAAISTLVARREGLADGAAEATDLVAQLDRAAAERNAILQTHPAWATDAPDADALRDAADAAAHAHRTRASDADAARETAIERQQAAASAVAKADADREAFARDERDAAAQLARLSADGLDDAARSAAQADAAMQSHAARALHERTLDAIERAGLDPTQDLARQEQALVGLRRQAEENAGAEKRAEGELDAAIRDGTYSSLSDVLEQIERTQRELDEAELEAAAIKLLHETVQAERSRLARAVLAPVEAIAADLMRRFAGPRAMDVRLDESFAPAAIATQGGDDGVPLAALSGGEREQVHLAVRLALADVLSRAGPQMVVLDDVLVATDAGRLGRILDVLAEYGRRMQIVILTCHPERYRAMPQATFIDLQACRDRGIAV